MVVVIGRNQMNEKKGKEFTELGAGTIWCSHMILL